MGVVAYNQSNVSAWKSTGEENIEIRGICTRPIAAGRLRDEPWETINVPINPKGWKMDYTRKAEGTGWIKEYVRPPETINDWTRLITLQFFDNVFTQPRAFMNHMESTLEGQCPNVDWQVIKSGKKRILYEWKIRKCPGHRDQHEISLLLMGDYGLYRAAYTKRGAPMDAATRKQWIQWLSVARIMKTGQ